MKQSRPHRHLTDDEIEQHIASLQQEQTTRELGTFKFEVSGAYSKNDFNHYEHVRNFIAKALRESGRLFRVRVDNA